MIAIEWPGMQVDKLQGALRGLRLGLAPLWAAGDLPALLGRPRARETIEAYEAFLFGAVDQWSRARASGEDSFTLRVDLPEQQVHEVLSLARHMCELMVDPDIMFAVGVPPVSSAEARFAVGMIEEAERAVAGNAGNAARGEDGG